MVGSWTYSRAARQWLVAARQLLSERGQANSLGQAELKTLAAAYLVGQTPLSGGDTVARFHLDNGARLECLNIAGDRSAKGMKQSHGLMVNYLDDLDRIESHHEDFTRGEIAHSRAVGACL